MKATVKLQLFCISVVTISMFRDYKIKKKLQHSVNKNARLYRMMNRWLQMEHEGKRVVDFLKQKQYFNIAIYGMGYAGERLQDDLENSNIELRYVIDQNANNIVSNTEIYTISDDLPEVDCIIMTIVDGIEETKQILNRKTNAEIISLEDILFTI